MEGLDFNVGKEKMEHKKNITTGPLDLNMHRTATLGSALTLGHSY